MKKTLILLYIFTVLLLLQSQVQAAPVIEKPLYQVTVVQNAAQAINYRNLKGSVSIDFKGTVLLPTARGHAVIKNKAGVIGIQGRFKNLAAPAQFGSEYMTYVFWAISPDGRATNLGELIIDDGESKLDAKTTLQALSLIVTAEPYFAVSQPSNVVILENAIKPDNTEKIELIDSKYELLARGEYTKNISATDLVPLVMDKKTPFYVYQARNAVQIAKAAGAEAYATDGFKDAQRLLALSETKEGGMKGRSMTAREAVQIAEASRSLAVKLQADEALMQERQKAQKQISSAKSQASIAAAGQVKAEDAQAKAELAKGQSDTERTAALALATSAAASSTVSQTEAAAARTAAEASKIQVDAANSRAQLADNRAEEADNRATAAESDKIALRAQLLQQLNAVLQTQDTARGLIVNMSGALFQTGSSELQPVVREKLAKIAGIVSSHAGLKLEVEGYTDSIGSDAYNQKLSENRAKSALDYLVSQGVPANSIASRGFGKTNPIESNDTAQGRERNRRVEIVLSGEAIETSARAD